LNAGGPTSVAKGDALQNEVFELFVNSNERLFKDDVSLLLDDIMESSFNTICEDESTDEIGQLLCTMFHQCCNGDLTLVTEALGN
jgi:hypothetical protein